MKNTLNIDNFAKSKLTLGGRDYSFRPPSIGDLIDYLDGEIMPRLLEAQEESDAKTTLAIQIEVIRRYIPELDEDILRSLTPPEFQRVYLFVKDGVVLEDDEKN